MKKLVVFIAAVLFALPLYAGVVKDVTGSADVLIGGKWQKAREGMNVPDGAKIMTGVSSTVRIDAKIGYFIVKELSMVTYSEKSSDKEVDQKVSIAIGKVRVRFTKAKGVKSSFKVQTPRGTASVRGTEKDVSGYPIAGMDVNVIEGGSDIMDNNGNSFGAFQGESGGVGGDGSLFGESDLNGDDAGFGDQFGDDDTYNDIVDDILGDFFDDWFGNFLDEPERL